MLSRLAGSRPTTHSGPSIGKASPQRGPASATSRGVMAIRLQSSKRTAELKGFKLDGTERSRPATLRVAQSMVRRFFSSAQAGLLLVIVSLGVLLTLFAGSHPDRVTGESINNF